MFLIRRLRNHCIIKIVQLQVFTNSFYFHSKSDFQLSLKPPFRVIFRHLVADCGIRQNLLKPKLIVFLHIENPNPLTLQNVGASVSFTCCLEPKRIHVGMLGGWNFMSWKGQEFENIKSNKIINFHSLLFLSLKNTFFLVFISHSKFIKIKSNKFLQSSHSSWFILLLYTKNNLSITSNGIDHFPHNLSSFYFLLHLLFVKEISLNISALLKTIYSSTSCCLRWDVTIMIIKLTCNVNKLF